MIKIDSAYLIGNEHLDCQDYAYHGIVNNIPFIIVSDGCSSAKDSDVGARYLTHTLVKNIERFDSYQSIVDELEYAIQTYPFSRASLIATIRFAFVKNNKLHLFHYGDGHTIIQKDSNVESIFTKFESNAPFYFYYNHTDYLKNSYIDQFYTDPITNEIDTFDVESFINNTNNFYKEIELTSGEYKVSVISDGIDSIIDPLPYYDYKEELVNYRNVTGEFVKRRLNKFSVKYKHVDDLSVAAMIINVE